MVSKALASGLKDDIKQFEQLGDVNADPAMIEEIQHSIVEFFSMLEIFYLNLLKNRPCKEQYEKNLMPTIDHIDSTFCDDATVDQAWKKQRQNPNMHPKENAQDLLFKELLKRWKPSKNMMN